MKVVFSFQKNNSSKPQRQNVVFGAGLTPKMMQEFQRADVLEISSRLAKKGTLLDCDDSKIIAWCNDKSMAIFEQLNRKYKRGFGYPIEIHFEGFNNLKDNPNSLGTCNMFPFKLRKNSNEIVNGKTVFFNSAYDWNNIDTFGDANFETGCSSTDFFLEPFLHEFSHIAHENRLLQEYDADDLLERILKAKNKTQVKEYRQKYGAKVAQICKNAQKDPMEAIAYDLSRLIINSLDKETLLLTKDPFLGTPYERLSILQRANIPDYSDEERPLNEILRRFWNGKFD